MFRKEINPYTVSDKVTFRNVDKSITLFVRTSAGSIVTGINQTQEKLKELKNDSDECQRINAARLFAKTVFGEEQADRLIDFYNDPMVVIVAVGMYFDKRLKKLITKAQKK